MPLAALGETVENGTFAAQLEDWSVQGGVFGDSAVAVLTDQDSRALLHQRVPIEFGEFVLSFDFRNALSTDVPSGTFRDTFFATLYFTDETGAPDIANSPPPDALPLFDLDAGGAYNVHPAARIGSSTKGLGWWSFSLGFQSSHAFAIPAFDLRDLNIVRNDSAVAIDNVSIIQVPEPASCLLMAAGAVICGGMRRVKRNSSPSL
jgi:hypothetical protein